MAQGTRWTGHRLRSGLALLAWLAVLIGAIATGRATGQGALAAPPLRSGAAGMMTWLEQRDAATAVFALVRVGIVAAAWYLLVTTLAVILTGTLRMASGRRALDAITLSWVRRVAEQTLGASLTISVVIAGAAPAGATTAPPPSTTTTTSAADAQPTIRRLADRPSPATTSTTTAARPSTSPPLAEPATPTIRRLPDRTPTTRRSRIARPSTTTPATSSPPAPTPSTDAGRGVTIRRLPDVPPAGRPNAPTAPPGAAPTTSAMPSPAPGPAIPDAAPERHSPVTMRRLPPPAPDTTTPADAPTASRTVTVAPGDSFWRLARRALVESWGAEPTDGQITAYWARFVETNRAVLVDRQNPDLLFSGQRLVLPPPPGRPAPPQG